MTLLQSDKYLEDDQEECLDSISCFSLAVYPRHVGFLAWPCHQAEGIQDFGSLAKNRFLLMAWPKCYWLIPFRKNSFKRMSSLVGSVACAHDLVFATYQKHWAHSLSNLPKTGAFLGAENHNGDPFALLRFALLEVISAQAPFNIGPSKEKGGFGDMFGPY